MAIRRAGATAKRLRCVCMPGGCRAGKRGSRFEDCTAEENGVNKSELVRVQQYLRDKFGTDRITLHDAGRTDGSAEVNLSGEFIGVIFRDDDDGEVSYAFHMAIMDSDLPVAAGVPSG